MASTRLPVYEWFARLPWSNSYTGKFLLIAFVGTHVPLLFAVLYFVLSVWNFSTAWPLLLVLVGATLAGAFATMFVLRQLLRPIHLTAEGLRRYAAEGHLPALPTDYDDEAGTLMRSAQETMTHLDELIRFKDRMFGVLAHDVRSPATSVLLASDVIAEQARSPHPNRDTIAEIAELIHNATQQQLDLTEAILHQIRRDTSGLQARYEPVDVAALLHSTAEPIRLPARRKGVALQLEADPAMDGTLYTDAHRLQQVLQNLLSNAVKFTPPGGTVALGATAEGGQIVFRVSDSGAGIDPDEIEELFQPYRTRRDGEAAGTDASEPSADGFGLGLWIVRTFTNLLGGTLEVDTSPGEGTTFYVRLDRRPAAAASDGAPPGEERPAQIEEAGRASSS